MADTKDKALLHIIKKLKEMEKKQDVIQENIDEILAFLNEIKEDDE